MNQINNSTLCVKEKFSAVRYALQHTQNERKWKLKIQITKSNYKRLGLWQWPAGPPAAPNQWICVNHFCFLHLNSGSWFCCFAVFLLLPIPTSTIFFVQELFFWLIYDTHHKNLLSKNTWQSTHTMCHNKELESNNNDNNNKAIEKGRFNDQQSDGVCRNWNKTKQSTPMNK